MGTLLVRPLGKAPVQDFEATIMVPGENETESVVDRVD